MSVQFFNDSSLKCFKFCKVKERGIKAHQYLLTIPFEICERCSDIYPSGKIYHKIAFFTSYTSLTVIFFVKNCPLVIETVTWDRL